MLWLAGLMGLAAVGAVLFVETGNAAEDETEASQDPAEHMNLLQNPDIDGPAALGEDETQSVAGGGQSLDLLNDISMDSETMTDADDAAMTDAAMAAATVITDFTPEEDSLLFVWDDTDEDSAAPEISLVPDPDNPEQLQVSMGDQVMAQVSGQSALKDVEIALIPFSSAEALDLVSA